MICVHTGTWKIRKKPNQVNRKSWFSITIIKIRGLCIVHTASVLILNYPMVSWYTFTWWYDIIRIKTTKKNGTRFIPYSRGLQIGIFSVQLGLFPKSDHFYTVNLIKRTSQDLQVSISTNRHEQDYQTIWKVCEKERLFGHLTTNISKRNGSSLDAPGTLTGTRFDSRIRPKRFTIKTRLDHDRTVQHDDDPNHTSKSTPKCLNDHRFRIMVIPVLGPKPCENVQSESFLENLEKVCIDECPCF